MRSLLLSHVLFAFIALLIGGVAGLLQGLVRGGTITLPAGIGYYQLLTAHGVLMALIFTTYFIIGFLYSGVSKTLGGASAAARKEAGMDRLLSDVGRYNLVCYSSSNE